MFSGRLKKPWRAKKCPRALGWAALGYTNDSQPFGTNITPNKKLSLLALTFFGLFVSIYLFLSLTTL
jgi:hypothetical protein